MKKYGKLLALLLAGVMSLSLAACGEKKEAEQPAPSGSAVAIENTETATPAPAANDMAVAMITDYGDITDQSFNQMTYEACKKYSEANGIKFNYYKPAGDTTPDRVAMIDAAIADGYTVLVMPGFAFGEALAETAPENPDTKFVALDVAQADLGDVGNNMPSNLYCATYKEELCGYMVGYAAVKLGYKHLGFLGGIAVPAVMRYGYGYIQGADTAAAEMGVSDIKVEYVYANQFFGDADITAYMDNWYQNMGVDVVFACGGGVYTSAAEAAVKVPGTKVIGVDVDQAPIIDAAYGDGLTITSAMKGLEPTVLDALTDIAAGNWTNYGGKCVALGLVSANPEENYVQIPMETTQWGDGFTQDDYKNMVAKMYSGEIKVSDDTSVEPEANATTVTVSSYGNIK